MHAIQNLSRKDGTYYFRRLVRLGQDKPFRLRVSLRTNQYRRARFMGPALALACEKLTMNMMRNIAGDNLTAVQRAEIFRRQIILERDRLEQLHAELLIAAPDDHDMVEDALKLRLDAGEIANLAAAANGAVDDFLVARVDPDDDPDKPIIVLAWSDLEQSVQGQPPAEAAAEHLADLRLDATPISLAIARKIIHQAKVEAIREFRATLENPAAAYGQVPLASVALPAADRMGQDNPSSMPVLVTPQPMAADSWTTMTATEAVIRFIEHNPRTGGTDGKARKKGPSWTAKTRKQFKLPALLLEQVMQHRPLAQVTHDDLVKLNNCFSAIHGPSFRKSERQQAMAIQDIVRETEALVAKEELSEAEIGLGVSTTNRHWGFLRQLTDWFSQHHPLGRLDYSAFFVDDERDPRLLTDHYTEEQGRALFSLPPWIGCGSWSKPFKTGDRIFHNAAYYVPLIAWYTGFRREEICGLELDDIEQIDDQWHFAVRPNAARRLKNASSVRLLPVAPELARLGLLDYVAALRAEGETLMFPELRPLSGIGTMGDAFYKTVWTKCAVHLPFLKPGMAVHSFRHTLATGLKAVAVAEDVRADILGHRINGETGGRYSKASDLDVLRSAVEKIPIVTNHLSPAPIVLLPRMRREGRQARKPRRQG
ncbi:site-specific integrase [Blastomonas fulva]|jgi:integrase|uniref:site-specific integrase n=1 Tax=Blastomonas fulva TaxID=1550728 RepID=UPI003D2B492D